MTTKDLDLMTRFIEENPGTPKSKVLWTEYNYEQWDDFLDEHTNSGRIPVLDFYAPDLLSTLR